MDLSLVTVSLDPETGEFPPAPLAGIDAEVVSVVEHFFHHDGLPWLLLVVHHRPSEKIGKHSRRRDNPADRLDPEQRRLYDRLRAWRQGRAEADGVPPYVVFNNAELVGIIACAPQSAADLKAVPGLGEKKLAKYGDALLEVLSADETQPIQPADGKPDGPATECLALQRALRAPDSRGRWRPVAIHTQTIHDPKQRLICISPFPDRVVAHALMDTIEPALERYAIYHSYACRVGKGQFRALRRAQHLAARRPFVLRPAARSYSKVISRASLPPFHMIGC